MDEKTLLIDTFQAAGLTLNEEKAERFLCYEALLLKRNEVMNLTAITEHKDIVLKHFLDSCMLLTEPNLRELLKEGADPASESGSLSLLDVGTGAGFPGIPLKIMRPALRITLLDSLKKRVDFLSEVRNALDLRETSCMHARAEDLARTREHRDSYDLVVSRAVSALPVLSEYCLPYVKPGGLFVAYKSGNPEEEIRDAKNAIALLSGEIESVFGFRLPESDAARSLILIRKRKPTADAFPRRAGKIGKKPL